MRKYETFFIVDPDLPDDVTTAIDDKLKSVVSNNGGTVINYVPWGKKKLAYPVKKHSRGLYVLMEYAGGSALVAELERNMRLDERVIKFITVKLEDRFDPTRETPQETTTPPVFGEDEESGPRAREDSFEEGEALEEESEEEEGAEDEEE